MGFLDRLRAMFSGAAAEGGASVREAMGFSGRARLIVHLFDAWGEEASTEYALAHPPGYEPLLIFEFAPHGERTWWTYTTAGMSLCPALDDHPPTELLAYSEQRAEGLVDLLSQLAVRDPGAIAYRVGDLAHFDEDPPDLGIPLGRHFGFAEPVEPSELLDFPNLELRAADVRFAMARPGEDATKLRFLRVVALAEDDAARFAGLVPEIAKARVWAIH